MVDDFRPALEGLTFTTERLLLRPLRDEDAAPLAELADQPQVAAGTLNLPLPYTLHHAETFIQIERESRAKGAFASSALTRRADKRFIGMMGLHFQWDHRRAEIGYWLGVPFWNQGYATEAARALLAFAFRDASLNRVFATHFSDNPASGRVMQKLGMTYEGVLRQHYFRFGQPKDAVCYGILRSEWEAQQTGAPHI